MNNNVAKVKSESETAGQPHTYGINHKHLWSGNC